MSTTFISADTSLIEYARNSAIRKMVEDCPVYEEERNGLGLKIVMTVEAVIKVSDKIPSLSQLPFFIAYRQRLSGNFAVTEKGYLIASHRSNHSFVPHYKVVIDIDESFPPFYVHLENNLPEYINHDNHALYFLNVRKDYCFDRQMMVYGSIGGGGRRGSSIVGSRVTRPEHFEKAGV